MPPRARRPPAVGGGTLTGHKKVIVKDKAQRPPRARRPAAVGGGTLTGHEEKILKDKGHNKEYIAKKENLLAQLYILTVVVREVLAKYVDAVPAGTAPRLFDKMNPFKDANAKETLGRAAGIAINLWKQEYHRHQKDLGEYIIYYLGDAQWKSRKTLQRLLKDNPSIGWLNAQLQQSNASLNVLEILNNAADIRDGDILDIASLVTFTLLEKALKRATMRIVDHNKHNLKVARGIFEDVIGIVKKEEEAAAKEAAEAEQAAEQAAAAAAAAAEKRRGEERQAVLAQQLEARVAAARDPAPQRPAVQQQRPAVQAHPQQKTIDDAVRQMSLSTRHTNVATSIHRAFVYGAKEQLQFNTELASALRTYNAASLIMQYVSNPPEAITERLEDLKVKIVEVAKAQLKITIEAALDRRLFLQKTLDAPSGLTPAQKTAFQSELNRMTGVKALKYISESIIQGVRFANDICNKFLSSDAESKKLVDDFKDAYKRAKTFSWRLINEKEYSLAKEFMANLALAIAKTQQSKGVEVIRNLAEVTFLTILQDATPHLRTVQPSDDDEAYQMAYSPYASLVENARVILRLMPVIFKGTPIPPAMLNKFADFEFIANLKQLQHAEAEIIKAHTEIQNYSRLAVDEMNDPDHLAFLVDPLTRAASLLGDAERYSQKMEGLDTDDDDKEKCLDAIRTEREEIVALALLKYAECLTAAQRVDDVVPISAIYDAVLVGNQEAKRLATEKYEALLRTNDATALHLATKLAKTILKDNKSFITKLQGLIQRRRAVQEQETSEPVPTTTIGEPIPAAMVSAMTAAFAHLNTLATKEQHAAGALALRNTVTPIAESASIVLTEMNEAFEAAFPGVAAPHGGAKRRAPRKAAAAPRAKKVSGVGSKTKKVAACRQRR